MLLIDVPDMSVEDLVPVRDDKGPYGRREKRHRGGFFFSEGVYTHIHNEYNMISSYSCINTYIPIDSWSLAAAL